MAAGSSTDVFIVRLRSPPIVNRRYLHTHRLKLFYELHSGDCVLPCCLVWVNEIVSLLNAVGAIEGRMTLRIRTRDLSAPRRVSGFGVAPIHELRELRVSKIDS